MQRKDDDVWINGTRMSSTTGTIVSFMIVGLLLVAFLIFVLPAILLH